MGSLCCVAARPHRANTASREWSIGRNDPFWRTSTSFSPPLSRRLNYRFHSEGLSFGSQGDGAALSSGSSLSSGSKGSRSWERSRHPPDCPYSASEGAISYFSSPEGSFQNQQLRAPSVEGVDIEEYVRDLESDPLDFSPFLEGTSRLPNSGSTSSRSESSESELIPKMHPSVPWNFPSHHSFISKPIHPLSLEDVRSPSLAESSGNHRGESVQCSASSIDFADVSESMDSESSGPSCSDIDETKTSKCRLCERSLSSRSPWSSCRIVRSHDMPVAGVLPCSHVYHAECLERTTPKASKHNPPCPVCEKTADRDPEQWAICRLKNGLPRLRSIGEGPSRVWSCTESGDCVCGALHTPKLSSMLLLSRNRLKRHLSMKGTSGKDSEENSTKSGCCSPPVDVQTPA